MPKRAVRSGQPRKRRESPQRARARKTYEARARAVRSLVTFALPTYTDASEYWRKKVLKYHRYLQGSEGHPGIANGVRARVTKRDPDKLKELQRRMGQGALRGIKYAFVPTVIDPETGTSEPVRVQEREDAPMIVSVGGTSHWSEPFNVQALLNDTANEVERVIRALEATMPDPKAAARFKLMNGGGDDDTRTIPGALLRHEVLAAVYDKLNRYGSHSPIVRRSAARWWGNWLYGLSILTARRQRTLVEYDQAQEIERERVKRVRTINTKWTYLLEALREAGGHAPTEPIAHRTTGSTSDTTVRPALSQLRKRGLIAGGDSRWTITAKGREYLTQALDVLDRFKL